jgi:hypothetical protein
MRLLLLVLSVMVAAADVIAAEPATPSHARNYTVKCAATVNVWVEVDSESLPAREPTNIETKKRVQFSLIDSAAYRGDAVLCNYATRRRDVATSYSIRCRQPRKERGYRHSYFCS